jgi:hypothetical protein
VTCPKLSPSSSMTCGVSKRASNCRPWT